MTTSQQEQEQDNYLVLLAYDTLALTKIAISEVFESIASNAIGQAFLKIIDRVFWTAEKTAQWALPDKNQKCDNQIVTAELVRPLPWILFIPLLISMRLFREGMSIVAFIFGKAPVKPSKIVRFLQSTRRSLRVIKYQGLRNMRSKTNKQSWMIARFIPEKIKMLFLWGVDKLHQVLIFHGVKYKNVNDAMNVVRVRRKNTIALEHAKKRRRDHSIENPDRSNVLNALLSDTEILHNSDSDTDFSLKNISQVSDTSKTSSDEDELEKPNQLQVNQNGPEHNEEHLIEHTAEIHYTDTEENVHVLPAPNHEVNQPNTSSVLPNTTHHKVLYSPASSKEELLLNGNVYKATVPEKVNENFLLSEIINHSPSKSVNSDRNTRTGNGDESQPLQDAGKDIGKPTTNTDKTAVPPTPEIKANQPVADITNIITGITNLASDENKSPSKFPATVENKPIQNNGTPPKNPLGVDNNITPQKNPTTIDNKSLMNNTPPKNLPDVDINNLTNVSESFTSPKITVSPLKVNIFGEDKISPVHHNRPLINLINHIKDHNGES